MPHLRDESCRSGGPLPVWANLSSNRRNGGGAIIVDRKDPVERADQKHLTNIGAQAEQYHLAFPSLDLPGQLQQYPKARATDVVKLGHINRKMRGVVAKPSSTTSASLL
jgi:hypothetical protein